MQSNKPEKRRFGFFGFFGSFFFGLFSSFFKTRGFIEEVKSLPENIGDEIPKIKEGHPFKYNEQITENDLSLAARRLIASPTNGGVSIFGMPVEIKEPPPIETRDDQILLDIPRSNFPCLILFGVDISLDVRKFMSHPNFMFVNPNDKKPQEIEIQRKYIAECATTFEKIKKEILKADIEITPEELEKLDVEKYTNIRNKIISQLPGLAARLPDPEVFAKNPEECKRALKEFFIEPMKKLKEETFTGLTAEDYSKKFLSLLKKFINMKMPEKADYAQGNLYSPTSTYFMMFGARIPMLVSVFAPTEMSEVLTTIYFDSNDLKEERSFTAFSVEDGVLRKISCSKQKIIFALKDENGKVSYYKIEFFLKEKYHFDQAKGYYVMDSCPEIEAENPGVIDVVKDILRLEHNIPMENKEKSAMEKLPQRQKEQISRSSISFYNQFNDILQRAAASLQLQPFDLQSLSKEEAGKCELLTPVNHRIQSGSKLNPQEIDPTAKEAMKRELVGGLYVDAFIPPKEPKIADHVRIDVPSFPRIIAASENDDFGQIKIKYEEAIAGLQTEAGPSLLTDADFILSLKGNLNSIFIANNQKEYDSALEKIKTDYPYLLAESEGFPATHEEFKKKPICALKFLTAALSYQKRRECISQILKDGPRDNSFMGMNLFGLEIEILYGILEESEKNDIKQITTKCQGLIKDPEMVKLFGEKFIADLSFCLTYIVAAYKNKGKLSEKEKKLIKDKVLKLFPYQEKGEIDSLLLGVIKPNSKPQLILKFLIEAFVRKAAEKMPLEVSYSQAQRCTGLLNNCLIQTFRLLPSFLNLENPFFYRMESIPKSQLKNPSEEAVNKFYFDAKGRFCVDFLNKTEFTFLIKNKDGIVTSYKTQFYIHEKYHLEGGVYVLDSAVIKGASANPKEKAAIEECVIALLSLPNHLPEFVGNIAERPLDFKDPAYTLARDIEKILLATAKDLPPSKDDVEGLSDGKGLLPINLEDLEEKIQEWGNEKVRLQSQLTPAAATQAANPAVQEPTKAEPPQQLPVTATQAANPPAVQEPTKAEPLQQLPVTAAQPVQKNWQRQVHLSPLLLTKEKEETLKNRKRMIEMAAELNGIVGNLEGVVGAAIIKNLEEEVERVKNAETEACR